MRMDTIAFADVGVPSPATMVGEAESIITGRFTGPPESAAFEVAEVMKGPKVNQPRVALLEPEQILGFDLGRSMQRTGPGRALLLGSWDKSRSGVLLRWFGASIWPSETAFSTFPSSTYESCLSFVQTVLGYHGKAASGREQLVAALLADADGSGIYAALDFTEASLPRYLERGDATTAKQVAWSLFAGVAARNGWDDAIDEQLAGMVPLLPVSLFVPRVLKLAEAAVAGKKADVLWRAQAAMAGRGLTSTRKPLDREHVDKLFKEHRRELRARDAGIALAMFDSPHPLIRDRFADLVLEQIVEKPRAAVLGAAPPAEASRRQDLWRKEVGKI